MLIGLAVTLTWTTILASILFGVALVVALAMAYHAWQEAHEEIEPASDAEILAELEQAHAEGELDDAELSRVRALLKPQSGGPGQSGRADSARRFGSFPRQAEADGGDATGGQTGDPIDQG